MLDLEAPSRSIGSIDLAGDSDDPFAFHVLPPPPRVAVAADGAPRVRLLRVVSGGAVIRAQLELVVELPLAQADLDAARAELTQETHDDKGRVHLEPVTVVGAEAELLFAGREPGPDDSQSSPLRRSYGVVAPLLDAPWRAAFSVPLTPAGAGLVEAALRSGGAPIGVNYRLRVEGLRAAQRVVGHVDWGRVYDHLSSEIKEGFLFAVDDIRTLTEHLVETRAIEIRAVQALVPVDGAPPPDLGPALELVQRELLERCCEPVLPLSREPARASLGTLGDVFGVGVAYALKQREQVERATADIDFQVRAVVTRTLAVQAHLADLLGGAPADAHIDDVAVDDPFFARASLHLTTARPLAAAFAREVIATFGYGATQIPIRLAADAPEGRAETWADQQPDRTWTLGLDVTLADDAPLDPGARVSLPRLTGQSRELSLDLAGLLGLWSLEVWASTDPRVTATRVELAQKRGGAVVGSPAPLMLTAAAPRLTAWLRDVRPGDRLSAAVHHLLADGRVVTPAEVAIDTRVVRLPPPFPGSMTVEVDAADDWAGLSRVIVTLQKSPELPAGTVTLDAAGATAAVALDLPDPGDRKYRYKVARTLDGGTVEEDDWAQTDLTVLLVGRTAANVLVVDVTPVGLELPEAGVNTIEVELEYVDGKNQVRSAPTAVIHARADVYHWVVPLKDPSIRAYQYRTIVHRTDGTTQTGPYTTAQDRILLIPVTKR